MFRFEPYAQVPERGGRLYHVSGGLVEVEEEGASRVVWGVGGGGMYIYDLVNKVSWKRVADGGDIGARLAVCGGSLVAIGGGKDDMYRRKVMVWREGRWSLMSHMLVGCSWPCVVSVGRCGLVVMGGCGGKRLNDVQVFNGQTWHVGPSLPQPCWAMSAVVYRGHVVVMGGYNMDRAVWCADINDLVSPCMSPNLKLTLARGHLNALIMLTLTITLTLHWSRKYMPVSSNHVWTSITV